MSAPVVSVRGLVKRYGALEAVKGITFDVAEGEVFGLLGPNGAGKTSTMEILEGLRSRDGGEVSVLGVDPGLQNRRLKDRIGVCLQSTALPWNIRVGEALELFGSCYSSTVDAGALLRRLRLADRRDSMFHTLSGGQKQRVVFALALLNDPRVVFLDEPSAGLDPQARADIHSLIQELRAERRTVIITTHYIEEAEKLCDRVAIVNQGRIAAIGTPAELQARTRGNSTLRVRLAAPLDAAAPLPLQLGDEEIQLCPERLTLTARSARPTELLVRLVDWSERAGAELTDIRLKQPSLEDVFLELTGKGSPHEDVPHLSAH